jgi:anti-sigma factor RsiW
MHNCKSTINSLTDVALKELQPNERELLLAELKDCETCQEEYGSIRETLRLSRQALHSTLPSEEFWTGYHARLINRIENQPAEVLAGASSRVWQSRHSFWTLFTASVRIPVSAVAATLLLLFGLTAFLSWKLLSRNSEAQIPTVITRTVTVPATQEKPQEKIITRVVYREKNTRERDRQFDVYKRQLDRTLAQTNGEAADKTPISLIGFKPTDQVKLQVLKGSYRDEK